MRAGRDVTLRVGARSPMTRAEGPGLRYALWLQGCSLRCPGCCNRRLFDPGAGQELAVGALRDELQGLRDRIEGVTLLGGEPFDQAAPLAALARELPALGLSLIAFSGYALEQLRARGDCEALLAACDVLVDGPFIAAQLDLERLWVGSTNQRFHYLTDRYSAAIERPAPGDALRTVEATIRPDGRLSMNGWPERLFRGQAAGRTRQSAGGGQEKSAR